MTSVTYQTSQTSYLSRQSQNSLSLVVFKGRSGRSELISELALGRVVSHALEERIIILLKSYQELPISVENPDFVVLYSVS